MTKKLLFILILGIAVLSVKAQYQYPKGVYLSFDELKSKQPSADLDIIVEKRTQGDIAMVGGNDYKLTSNNKSVKKSYLRNDVFAYSDGDSLFLNGLRLRLFSGYIKVLNDGNKYFIFKASVSQDGYSNMFGAVGGAIQAVQRYLYVYDKSTGIVTSITIDTLKKLLKNNENMLEKYLNEKDKENEELQLKYLIMLNGVDE